MIIALVLISCANMNRRGSFMPTYQQPSYYQPQVNCTSYTVGNYLYTNCY